jgi:hypothetical protein
LIFRVEFFKEVIGQKLDIVFSLRQRRDMDGYHVDSPIEILPEPAFVDLLDQILVGGRHDFHIYRYGFDSADAHDLFLLQNARSSFTCISGGISAISSRKMVPPKPAQIFPGGLRAARR